MTAAYAQQKGAWVAAHNATHAPDHTPDSVRDREIESEQAHLDRVYQRLEEKIPHAPDPFAPFLPFIPFTPFNPSAPCFYLLLPDSPLLSASFCFSPFPACVPEE
ncbi:hypothetical protein SAZ_18070 [Streptomyces noursei ZPM]|nr:hypothetical protein SAZ_18070 [Streptomyces noursei ZPM]